MVAVAIGGPLPVMKLFLNAYRVDGFILGVDIVH